MKNVNVALVAALAVGAVALVHPDAAFAMQTDPFAQASTGAETLRKSLTSFALAVGGIGMVACLLLGFFGKLNWKWVATGIGVSFALAVVPTTISWVYSLAGNG